MRVVDLIKSTDNTAFSFEILPPLKGTGIEKLYKTVDTLREFDPKYINITTHRSEYVYKELGNGLYQRTRQRRRPGTVAVAAALQNKYNITTVPHIMFSWDNLRKGLIPGIIGTLIPSFLTLSTNSKYLRLS